MTTQDFPAARAPRSFGGLIATGLGCWVVIAFSFLGLHILMEERPEFVGQPMSAAKTELIQEAPRVVVRKLSDDVAVIKTAQPESSEVSFEMRGRRDYRGLRTVMDMAGEFHARNVLVSAIDAT